MIIDLRFPDPKIIRIDQFPDSQVNVTLLQEPGHGENVDVISGAEWSDVQKLISLSSIIRNKGTLYIPYLLGARSDRKFTNNGTFYLQDVISPLINNLKFKRVKIFDPHSNVACDSIKNSIACSNIPYARQAISDMLWDDDILFNLVAVDKGSTAKIQALKKEGSLLNANVVQLSKTRNLTTGTITDLTVESKILPNAPSIIVDDIIDGGATFIRAKEVMEKQTKSSFFGLIASHGIFSNGVKVLKEHFNYICVTDSRPQMNNFRSDISVYPCAPFLLKG